MANQHNSAAAAMGKINLYMSPGAERRGTGLDDDIGIQEDHAGLMLVPETEACLDTGGDDIHDVNALQTLVLVLVMLLLIPRRALILIEMMMLVLKLVLASWSDPDILSSD